MQLFSLASSECQPKADMPLGKDKTGHYILISLALVLVSSIYFYQFYFQGGQSHLNPDGEHYLAYARGEIVERPFNTRMVGPAIAFLIAEAIGVSLPVAYHLITLIGFLGSLILLIILLDRHCAPVAYQVAVVISFGAGTAVLLGHAPVLVDALLLLFTCLTIIARARYLFGLGIVCLAALTKEYGVFLALPWVIQAYRRKGMLYAAGVLLPFILLVSAVLFLPGLQYDQHGSLGKQGFLVSQFKYQLTQFKELGALVYGKTLYIWAWVALWPVVLISAFSVINKIIKRRSLPIEQAQYGILLITLPVLLSGDWDRSLLVLTPFAIIAVSRLSITQNTVFCFLLGTGGLATALARPYYTETIVPRTFTISMIAVSVTASSLLAFFIGYSLYTKRLHENKDDHLGNSVISVNAPHMPEEENLA